MKNLQDNVRKYLIRNMAHYQITNLFKSLLQPSVHEYVCVRACVRVRMRVRVRVRVRENAFWGRQVVWDGVVVMTHFHRNARRAPERPEKRPGGSLSVLKLPEAS